MAIKLTATTLTLVFALSVVQSASSASIWGSIPGANFLKDLTITTLDSVNNAIDGTLSKFYYSEGGIEDKLEQCVGCIKDPDTNRNVSEIIRSRGYNAEEYDVLTKDGYLLTIQRIVNPLVDAEHKSKLKPVIMQHGLMSSSVDWVINSINVKPEIYPKTTSQANVSEDSQRFPNSLGFYLANEGYDVFLANSRGNIYGQRHINLSSWQPKFWDFSYDEQISYDLPDTIAFVQRLTNHKKVGYVGHSQGTLMMFGLLADKPEYADIVEPFIALAPVAYVDNTLTPVKHFSVLTPIFEHVNMWFATSTAAVKYLGPIVCGPKPIRKDICENIFFLSTGFDPDELDDTRVSAYLSHMPSGTSVKNIAHYGQGVRSKRFAHFDHGFLQNERLYGKSSPPDYELSKIKSKSIVLFTAENDWLAAPKDVARLKADLTVQPYAVYNLTEVKPKWNHIDFVYGKDAGKLVNSHIAKVMDHYRLTQ